MFLLLLPFLLAWAPAPQGGGTTGDPSQIVVTQLHIFLRRAEDRLEVHEFYLVSNTGDQTYVGREDPQTGRRHTLTFALPPQATDLQILEPAEEHWARLDGGLAYTEPISPGSLSLELAFQYTLPFAEGMEVERAFPVQVTSLGVLAFGDLAAEGSALTPGGVMDTAQGPVRVYTAGPLDPGQPVRFRVRTEPVETALAPATSAPAAQPSRNPTAEIALGLAALAVAVVAAYVLLRPPAPGPVPASVRAQVEAIAALDEEYQQGQLGEKEYRRRREALKREARDKVEQER
ncbi:MAG: hypothetical protein H5T61_14850 [Thermoflexales bacterium]|nr:hypothetical protein [Thermoflexales bacterium]